MQHRAVPLPRPPRLALRKELARHLRAGHPWVFRDALANADLPTGTVVDVVDRGGAVLGRGLYDRASPIAVRICDFTARAAIDHRFVEARLGEALAARRGVIDPRESDAFRWCNGEGDFLPGVVVDLYGPVAVVRFDGAAAATWRPWVVQSVARLGAPLGVRHVYERSRGEVGAVLHGGPPPVPVEIREAQVRFAVDVVHGQKTGTFLDQRENRRAIRPFAAGARVLNLFAYQGGFSVHAALAGARTVLSVDAAAAALDAARANFVLNRLDPAAHEFVCDDAFAFLQRAHGEGRRFDLVIVDPPSFAPSEKALPRALLAYRDLHAAALRLLAPSGVIAFASCSSHVTHDAFVGTIRDGAGRAGVPLRLLEVRGQPGDHPTPPAFVEGRYLKFILARARPAPEAA